MEQYKPITFLANAFSCPHCGVFSRQQWLNKIEGRYLYGGLFQVIEIPLFTFSKCGHCYGFTIWKDDEFLIFPTSGTAPLPNHDLPDEIKADYEEARSIVELSPRGAAALLRLVVQKLCVFLGEKGKVINDDINSMVEKGLPMMLSKALHIVRVVGNDAVHPGQIDFKDNREVANQLFGLVNIIADYLITQPKHVDMLFSTLVPESKQKEIERREKKANP